MIPSLDAQRLQRLTQDILDVSRIESKSLDLKKELFNLSEMILNVIGDYNRVSKDHQDTANLKLEFTGSKEGIFIEADKSRINQVVSNLLNNAKLSINLFIYEFGPNDEKIENVLSM